MKSFLLNSFLRFALPLDVRSTALALVCLSGWLACTATVQAETSAVNGELARALLEADKERVEATLAGDESRLKAILSDELHYAHSSGVVDDKKVFIDTLVTKKSQYLSYTYKAQNFSYPAPNIALMTGEVDLQVNNAKGKLDLSLGYLAVWRLENGKWRFLAWQSCRLPVLEVKP
jgi:hypothetical protein